jgi:hypothetical protein
MANKKYFPNNWQEYAEAPDDCFQQHTFEEIMTWKVAGWELPSSVYCIIREMNLKTGQVKEHTYQRKHAARAKVEQLLSTPDTEFVVADNESIHHLFPGDYNDDVLDDED